MDKDYKKMNDQELFDEIKEWAKLQDIVTMSGIVKNFSTSYPKASRMFETLVEEEIIVLDKGFCHPKGKELILNLPLKIYLLDVNINIINEWKKVFKDYTEVEVVYDDFKHFLDTRDVEYIVSPGNSFGIMDGGYDYAIKEYFGEELEDALKKEIEYRYCAEEPVASSLIIDIPNTNKKLIHTPTMKTPSVIKDTFVIYQCMRTTLIKALESRVESIVIPAFGGATGAVEPKIIAIKMLEGFNLNSRKNYTRANL